MHVQFEKVPYHINIAFILQTIHSHLPVGMAVSVFNDADQYTSQQFCEIDFLTIWNHVDRQLEQQL